MSQNEHLPSHSLESLLVDCGASSHIITDLSKFIEFDDDFKPEHHVVELADGSRASSVAEKRGIAVVDLRTSDDRIVQATLENA